MLLTEISKCQIENLLSKMETAIMLPAPENRLWKVAAATDGTPDELMEKPEPLVHSAECKPL